MLGASNTYARSANSIKKQIDEIEKMEKELLLNKQSSINKNLIVDDSKK